MTNSNDNDKTVNYGYENQPDRPNLPPEEEFAASKNYQYVNRDPAPAGGQHAAEQQGAGPAGSHISDRERAGLEGEYRTGRGSAGPAGEHRTGRGGAGPAGEHTTETNHILQEVNRVSRDYIPPDKESRTVNPIPVLSVMAVVIIGLILAIIFLFRNMAGSIEMPHRRKAGSATQATAPATTATEKAPTAATEETPTATTEETPTTAKQDTSATTQEAPAATTQSPSDSTVAGLSDNPADCSFSLNGIVYQLPCKYSLLTDNGWSLSPYSNAKESDMVGSKKDAFAGLVNGDDRITISVYNPDSQSKPLKDCVLQTISGGAESSGSFTVAGGITPLSSQEEVISVFGKPTRISEADDFNMLYYRLGSGTGNKYAFFYLYKDPSKARFSSIMLGAHDN